MGVLFLGGTKSCCTHHYDQKIHDNALHAHLAPIPSPLSCICGVCIICMKVYRFGHINYLYRTCTAAPTVTLYSYAQLS